MRIWLLLLVLALAGPAWGDGFYGKRRPKLVVFIVVDQLKADALSRFEDQFLEARQGDGKPGGFRLLLEQGAHHSQCYFDTLPCHTGTDHATLATGSDPSLHGIVGNWWFTPENGELTEAFTDKSWPQLTGNTTIGVAPTLLEGSTFSDEIKLASNGRSRVFSVAVKSRSAVLLGGHAADLALWLDTDAGGWTTSRYYRRNGKLPEWLREFNKDPWVRQFVGGSWNYLAPPATYQRSQISGQPGVFPLFKKGLPHAYPRVADKSFFEEMAISPVGMSWTFRLARKIVEEEKLGEGGPDVLCLSLSSYDKLGHLAGPYGPEMHDALLRLDVELSQFFAFLQDRVGLEHCLVVLTSDHGSSPVPEQAAASHMPGGRGSTSKSLELMEAALSKRFGPGKYVTGFSEPHVALNRKSLSPQQLPEARKIVVQALAHDPSVKLAWTSDEISAGRLPPTPLAQSVARSFFPGRSGDVFVINRPFWIYSFQVPFGATHGGPWTYDSHVPLLMMGGGIRSGRRVERCHPQDMVATLCELLRVTPPAGCIGRVLRESLEGER